MGMSFFCNLTKFSYIYLLIFFLFPFFLQKIEKPFLSAVQTTLGDRYTENIESIYKITIKFIIETLVTGFENSANSTTSNNTSGGGICLKNSTEKLNNDSKS